MENQLSRYVEFYDEEQYLKHSSLIENIVFGMPSKTKVSFKKLSKDEIFLKFFKDNDLYDILIKLGHEITFETVDLLDGLFKPRTCYRKQPNPS